MKSVHVALLASFSLASEHTLPKISEEQVKWGVVNEKRFRAALGLTAARAFQNSGFLVPFKETHFLGERGREKDVLDDIARARDEILQLEKKSDAAAKKRNEIEAYTKELAELVRDITKKRDIALADVENREDAILEIAEQSNFSEKLKSFQKQTENFRKFAETFGENLLKAECSSFEREYEKLDKWYFFTFIRDETSPEVDKAIDAVHESRRNLISTISMSLEICTRTTMLKAKNAEYRASFKDSEQTMVKEAAYAYILLTTANSVYKTLDSPQFISSDLFINLVRFAARPEQLISLNARGQSEGIFDWTATVPNLTWWVVILWAMNPWELKHGRMVLQDTQDNHSDDVSTDSEQSSLGPGREQSLDGKQLRTMFEKAKKNLNAQNAKKLVCFLNHTPLEIIKENIGQIIKWISSGAPQEIMDGLGLIMHTSCLTASSSKSGLFSWIYNLFCPTDQADCD